MKRTAKRIFFAALALLLALLLTTAALAADPTFTFDLTVDGEHTRTVNPGDIITVLLTLRRTDADTGYNMYAMQDELLYDPDFFELVEDGALLTSGVQSTDITLRDGMREFYMNYLSLSGGAAWNARTVVGTVQFRVIAESGTSKIMSRNYLVSREDGSESYVCTAEDVTIVVSTDCRVKFESNGGTAVEDQTVAYGETVARPEDPQRDDWYFAGWYADMDFKTVWDFENDTVQGNMTLYARWSKDKTEAVGTTGSGPWLWVGIGGGIVLLGLILLLALLRKTVRFETGVGSDVDNARVWRGQTVKRPADPHCAGARFGGWYADKARTKLWNFEEDTVEKNMTLYARWL